MTTSPDITALSNIQKVHLLSLGVITCEQANFYPSDLDEIYDRMCS